MALKHRAVDDQRRIFKNRQTETSESVDHDFLLRQVNDDGAESLRALLVVEEAARNATSIEELYFLLSNQIRKLTRARQVFVFREDRRLSVVNISGLPAVDRVAPVVRGTEGIVSDVKNNRDISESQLLDLQSYPALRSEFLRSYPYSKLMWIPLQLSDAQLFGGVLLASEQEWSKSDFAIASRLAATYSHALAFLQVTPKTRKKLHGKNSFRKRLAGIVGIAALVGMLIPIPMIAMAPVEVTAANPFVVSAPINGVIEDILVKPNDTVTAGQPIVRFDQTALRNQLEVAERQVRVAEASRKKANQLAFSDSQGRYDLNIAIAEHQLKIAEFEFAQEKLLQATLSADRAGVAIFADRQELIGKPTTIGERIMYIADPNQVELAISLDVNDSIALKPGGNVRVFLDSDPLTAHGAIIKFANYQSQIGASNALVFKVVADLSGDVQSVPRLGARGTAQLFGSDVPLGIYLFRRPISALRQWIGL